MSAANTTEKGELSSHIETWTKDKASADLLGLEWAALQGKYYKIEDNIKYVTKGSIIACDNGTLFSRIDLPIDHGVEVKSNHLPIMTTEDFGSQNIPLFGICKKRTTSEVTYHCSPAINNQWIQNANTTAANKAALLQADAFAVCAFGGIICVKEVNKTPQESMMVIYRDQYGFDEKTTKIILDLYKAIQDRYPAESQMARDWRFTRILGGLKYGLEGDEKASKVIQWDETAGDVTKAMRDITFVDDNREQTVQTLNLNLQMKAYITSELGLSGEDYEYLKYKVRIQNYLVGRDANSTKYDVLGYLDNKKYPDGYRTNMSTAYSRAIQEPEFIRIWNQQCDEMCGMTDFAHQQITTATIFATEVSKQGTIVTIYFGFNDRKRERMAGWLGDATIKNKETKQPSFGNDDYMADLDAENIAHMVRHENYSFIEAVQVYYGERLLEDNRAEQFLKYNSLSEVKESIFEELIRPILNVKLSVTNGYQAIEQLKEQYKRESFWMDLLKTDVAPDAYDFIRSLEQVRPLPEMGDFQ